MARRPAPVPAEDPYAHDGDQLRGYGAARGRDPYDHETHGYEAHGYEAQGHDPYDRDPYASYDDHDGGRRRRPPVRRGRRWPKVLAGLVAVVLLVGVGGYFYLDSRLKREAVLQDYAGRVADTPGTNWLIVGSDSRAGLSRADRRRMATGRAEGRRTDSMMLLHYGAGGTTLVSLPRDSYVPIPGRGSNKLNAAFAFGGPRLLVQTVEKATGVRIDHYAEIGFGGFVGVVDAIGGVEMCVKEPMRDPKAGLNLQPGCQELDGAKALGYVRTRASARADLDRVQRQRQFFGALMKRATSPSVMFNPFRSVPLALNATENFTVDEDDHLYDLVRMMWAMRGVTGGDGVTTTVPIGGNGSAPGVGAYITWDRNRAGRLFEALRSDQRVPADVVTK
ncbi:LCP family protein [Actinomadura namibiensis]|uniref:LCP family protein required for cell wall assembly n=1 Tax=Actinomadura namibiensis TaxID=182080 RepID=A0A7W3QM86_ACTNM|nr:LCP family protein [Actinomadura namibiensis]MBA8952256.1 LCP family protein required for cell wall assembly [Actinomadura namibiensis]